MSHQHNSRAPRGRRSAGFGSSVNHVMRAVKKHETYQAYVPPIRQPTATGSWTMPHTIMIQFEAQAMGISNVKIEDLVKADLDIPKLTITNVVPEKIEMRVLDVCAYGLWDKTTNNIAKAMEMKIFDPLTGKAVKTNRAQGDIDNPPRLGFRIPPSVSSHVFAWDGTDGTSAPVFAVKSGDPMRVVTYTQVVFKVAEPWGGPGESRFSIW